MPMFRTIASFASLLLLSLAARAAAPTVPATTAQDPNLPSLTVDGYRFHAQSFGDNRLPVLIVLHRLEGWRASGAVYDAMIGRMGDDPAFAASLSFRQGVKAFTGPVLFLTGKCSPRMGEAQQRRHMVHFRQARLVNLPDAGHAMFNDQPAASMSTVREFLTEQP
ncbi:alpha/beta fold hydrolase [Hydrogenophaga sp. RWCD_12]|uniref:alpha/beta fold hydrolase n=1 Tax=Hydrogenophaga sp. RWCD_12 TaxID=3391190 RepID=UPI0039852B46